MPCPDIPEDPTYSKHLDKGCIHWFDPEPQYEEISSQKARPYIIIGRYNHNSSKAIISPLSDIENYKEDDQLKYPYHAGLYVDDYNFLDKDCAVLLDQIYTIPKKELWQEWYMGKVDENDLGKIDMSLCYNFDLFDTIYWTARKFIESIEDWHKNKYSRE